MKKTSVLLAAIFSIHSWADNTCTTHQIVDYAPPAEGKAGLIGSHFLVERTGPNGAKTCLFIDRDWGFISAPLLFNQLLKTPLTDAQKITLKSTEDSLRKPPKSAGACNFTDNSRVEIQNSPAFAQAILSMVNAYGEVNKLNTDPAKPTYKVYDMIVSPKNDLRDLKPLVEELKSSTSISLQTYCKLGYFASSPPNFSTQANDQIMSLTYLETPGACRGSISDHSAALEKAKKEPKSTPASAIPEDGIPTGTYDRTTGVVTRRGVSPAPSTNDTKPIFGRTYIVGKNKTLSNTQRNVQTFQSLLPNWFNTADANGCVAGVQGKFPPAPRANASGSSSPSGGTSNSSSGTVR